MKLLLVATLLVVTGCSSLQKRAERTPQCLSLCNNNFAACTEEFPGSHGACNNELSSCQTECEAQQAMERTGEEEQEGVVVPVGSDEGPAPE